MLKAIAQALNLSAEQLLQQAGMLEGEPVPIPKPPTVAEAVKADTRLTKDQKAALLSVYESFLQDG